MSLAALLILVSAILASACAPAAPAGSSSSVERPVAAAPKVLTVGIQQEPTTLVGFVATTQRLGGGAPNVYYMVHDDLLVENDRGAYEARLVREQISVEKGTWKVNPDGSMETTWTLLPNIKWHDGTPFTANDLLFTIELLKDPETTTVSAAIVGQYMQSASAPDPATFTIHWSAPYAEADRLEIGTILPAHLLRNQFLTDKQAFMTSRHLNVEFVGLGPYRIANWELGSFVEVSRFDDYFLGRPPLDRVIVKFLGDPNTMIAAILSGAVDLLLPLGIELESAFELDRRWKGTGNRVQFDLTNKLIQYEIQYRPEYARPRNGLVHRGVRQALLQATDRQAIVDLATAGVSSPADSWFRPNHELRPRVESAIPQFPYDLGRAQRLLAEEGWVRRGDGTLVHSGTGELFETEVWALVAQSPAAEQVVNVTVDGWKSLGASVGMNLVQRTRALDLEYTASYPAVILTDPTDFTMYQRRLHTRNIPSAANRWQGSNRGAYVNPRTDAISEALALAIDPAQRIQLHRDLLQEQMGSVALMPLFWGVAAIPMVKGVSGPTHVRNTSTWNMFRWDKTESGS
jgi:peptide/nickel transport system substrate-binding protein